MIVELVCVWMDVLHFTTQTFTSNFFHGVPSAVCLNNHSTL